MVISIMTIDVNALIHGEESNCDTHTDNHTAITIHSLPIFRIKNSQQIKEMQIHDRMQLINIIYRAMSQAADKEHQDQNGAHGQKPQLEKPNV